MATSKTSRFLKQTLVYAVIIFVTLLMIDGICNLLGLFPPAMNFGDADLGWRSGGVTGRMTFGKCTEFSTGEAISFQRNEDGVRTPLSRAAIMADTSRVRIG